MYRSLSLHESLKRWVFEIFIRKRPISSITAWTIVLTGCRSTAYDMPTTVCEIRSIVFGGGYDSVVQSKDRWQTVLGLSEKHSCI